MMPVRFNCTNGKPMTMRLRLNGYGGKVRLYFPKYASASAVKRSSKGFVVAEDFAPAKAWAEPHLQAIFRNFRSKRPFNREFSKQRIENVERMLENDHMLQITNAKEAELRNIECGDDGYIEFYLLLERPPRSRVGQSFPIEVLQLDAESKEVIGGLSARVDITKEPQHLEYKLEVSSGKTRHRGVRLLRAYVRDANGDRVDARRTQIKVFSGRTELAEMRWHGSWRSYFLYLRARVGARVSVEAFVDGRSIDKVNHKL